MAIRAIGASLFSRVDASGNILFSQSLTRMQKDISMEWLRLMLEHKAIFVPVRKMHSARLRMSQKFGRLTGRYGLRQILSAKRGNSSIHGALSSRTPFMAARLGSSELDAMRNGSGIEQRRKANSWWQQYLCDLRGEHGSWREGTRFNLSNTAGFFTPSGENLERFVSRMRADLAVADLMGVFFWIGEAEALDKYAPQTSLASALALEPYYFEEPWSQALEGRRVLVVHPFTESIRQQYRRRAQIFSNPRVLPAFDLVTIPAVQSVAGKSCGFGNWFEALDSMCEKIASTKFDVAIIGAGAYGLPLAAFCKRLGRQAIHLGGATQILFGIRGRRWDTRPEVAGLYNEFWIRPSSAETPSGHLSVDDGSYW